MSDQRTAEQLLAESGSFQRSRILLTAAELDLFSKLDARPATVEDLAATEGWGTRGLRILMDALAVMGFLTKGTDERYSIDPSLAPLLTRDGTESILPMVLHQVSMWNSWSNLTDIVRTGENRHRMEIESRPRAEVEAFIGAMHVIGSRMADMVAGSLDLTGYGKMLDIGGGSGTYTMAFLKHAPHMTATLFDLPAVIEMAQERLAGSAYLHRVQLVAGDYSTDELPAGHDLALLSAIIHSNSREQNRELYRRTARSLKPEGTVLIRDYIMDGSRTFPKDGAIFAVNMLAATSGGNCYTFEEVKEDLELSGFQDVRIIREGTHMDQVVAAKKKP